MERSGRSFSSEVLIVNKAGVKTRDVIHFMEVRHGLCVFLLTFVFLAVPAWFYPLTGVKTNPILEIRAQDEAFYSSIALRMAFTGEWLTPKFLGRYAFNKPPLGVWLPALSVKVFGPNKMALRLPSLLAAATSALFLFLWLTHFHRLAVGWAGVFFLLSSYWFLVLGKVAMTDSLLLAFMMGSYYLLAIDPGLEKRNHILWFGVLTGLAIMTKSIAAFPAFAVLLAVAPRSRKLPALLITAAIALLIAAPWHAYQMWAVPKWFWAEYVLDEHLQWGMEPPLPKQMSNLFFYGYHLFRISPWIPICAAIGFATLWKSPQERNVPLAATGLTALTMLAFQYQNATYLLEFSALLCVIAARVSKAYPAGIGVLFAIFALYQTVSIAWPLRTDPAVEALENYCASSTSSELVLTHPDDEFYSAALPFPRVRYCFRMDPHTTRQSPLDLWDLGIIVSASDFETLEERTPAFRKKLQDMGLDSPEPIGTVIVVSNENEIDNMIQSHPEIDFLVPTNFLKPEINRNHLVSVVSAKHTLLAARNPKSPPRRKCGLMR